MGSRVMRLAYRSGFGGISNQVEENRRQLGVKTMLFLIPVLFVLCSLEGYSQEATSKAIVVTGTVSDFDGKPIKGALIYVDSIKTRIKTDKKGYYHIEIDPRTKTITAISYKHGIVNVAYSGQEEVHFAFSEDHKAITKRALINLGYSGRAGAGSSNRSGNSGANRDQGYDNYQSVFDLLAARFSGVQVSGNTIIIRGNAVSVHGDGQALVMVNGNEVRASDLRNLSPSRVKSVQVLKGNDASYYGLRGANGVVLITLKK